MNNTLYNEIVEQVKQKFPDQQPTDYTDWNDLPKSVDKKSMLIYARDVSEKSNLHTSELTTIFDQLNIDIKEYNPNKKSGKVRSNVYKTLLRRSDKTVARPVPTPSNLILPDNNLIVFPTIADVLIDYNDPYIRSADNSIKAKMERAMDWFMEGESNKKKKKSDCRRGGEYSYGPKADRTWIFDNLDEFVLTLCPDYCPVALQFGIKIKLDYGNKPESRGYDSSSILHNLCKSSLDRVDPRKGYVEGNLQVFASRWNTLKNNAFTVEIGMLYQYMQSTDKQVHDELMIQEMFKQRKMNYLKRSKKN